MFQNVFATVLLCSCVASGTRLQDSNSVPSCNTNNINYVSNDRELKPREVVSSNRLYGSYCLRNDIDYSYLDNGTQPVAPQYWGVNYSFDLTDAEIYCYQYYNGYTNYERVEESLYLYTSSSYVYTFHVDCEYEYDDTIVIQLGYGDLPVTDQYLDFVLIFAQPYYLLDSVALELFNLYFTQQGNTANTVYNGWFTFNQSLDFTGVQTSMLQGYILGNNTLFDRLYISNTGYIAFQNESTGYDDVPIYKNGAFQQVNGRSIVRQVYFTNVMIPNRIMDSMDRLGAFDYIPNTTEYTFGEMVFSVMDAPIYMLSQLFSFQLFGIEFYVAFMSIVTVILIAFVIRKII